MVANIRTLIVECDSISVTLMWPTNTKPI